MIKRDELPHANFSRNYLLLAAYILPMTAIGIFLLFYLTIPFVKSVITGINLPGPILASSVIVNILIHGSVLFAWLNGYIEGSVSFTETAIEKKGIFTRTTINWSDIESIYMIGYRITVISPNNKLRINTMVYREPEKMMDFIRDQYSKRHDSAVTGLA